MEETSIVIVGICGYGGEYLRWLEEPGTFDYVKLNGLVDLQYEKMDHYDRYRERGIPFYRTLTEFYKEHRADLAIIAAPIHFHRELTELAVSQGSHVLCEKPVAGCVADGLGMKTAAQAYNKQLAIGFQWSFSPPILDLKKDIVEGVWGKAILLKTIVLWPRNTDYYTTRGWAGKQFAPDGRYIMDSIASNATAHYIHNMLFILGGAINKTADFHQVNAKLYRANDIETFDGCQLHITTTKGVDILFHAAHCSEKTLDPKFEFVFENGKIVYDSDSKEVRGIFSNGETKSYGFIGDNRYSFACVTKALSTGDFSLITCDIDTAMTHLRLMADINEHISQVHVFPPEEIRKVQKDGQTFVQALGFGEKLLQDYEKHTKG